MESEPSFELESLVFTPSDAGFPFLSPPSDLPFPSVQPSHTRESAIAAAVESWEPPHLSSTATDLELVEKYLRPVVRPAGFPDESPEDLRRQYVGRSNPEVVNAGLPSMDPWGVPGIMHGRQGRREKYYLADNHQLRLWSDVYINTQSGFWKQKGLGYVVRNANSFSNSGIKSTYIWIDTSQSVNGIKTNWVMNVYKLINDAYVEEELVLCHVFEAPPDYDAQPKRSRCDQGRCRCSGNHRHEGINAYQNGDPRLTPYMKNLESILLGEPDGSMDSNDYYIPTRGISPTDNHGRKRKKNISDVWKYFTRIKARDLEGNVITLAACNHCSKVLTAKSKDGTSHLANHTCPCKFKPVQAGRKDKGVVNVLSPQASLACR